MKDTYKIDSHKLMYHPSRIGQWLDAGDDWQPLMILTGEDCGLLNNKAVTAGVYTTEVQDAGAHMIMASFGYKLSDKLSLSTVIGGGWADAELEGNSEDADVYSDEYGWEIDLGMEYKILDNLTYSANFGYWEAGDFFNNGASAAVGDDSIDEEVVMLTHSLNMTF